MADAKITISATDLASDVFTRVAAALKDTGSAAGEASPHVDSFGESVKRLGDSFVARVAEGVLLRDAIHEVLNVVKEGLLAFPELVEHTIQTGNSLYEMSLKTGASVENLSALRYVASQTGIDFESFGNTLFKMEQALGASGAKADEMQKHLDVLGLNLQTLKNEKPDQAFIDIMSALEEMPNRADQAAAGMAIFGRGFKEMAGLTQESITDLIAEAQDLGLVMSTETAAAAHAAEIGFKGFSMQLEAVGMEVGATVLPALLALTKLVSGEMHSAIEGIGHPVIDLRQTVEDVIVKMLDWASAGISTAQFLDNAFQGTKAMLFDIEAKVVGVASAFIGFLGSAVAVADKIPGMRGDFTGLASSLQDSATWLGGFQQGLKDESDGAIDAAGKHAVLFDGLRTGIADMKDHFHDAFTKAGEEITDYADKSKSAFGGVGSDVEGAKDKVDKFGAAMADLASAGTTWQTTLEGIDGAVVQQSLAYLAAGVSANTLKVVYGLTEVQVKALERAHQDYVATLKEVQKVEDSKNANSLKGLEDLNVAQAKANKQQMDDTVRSITETEKLWVDYYDRIDAATLSATDYKKLKVQEWFDNEVLKLKDDDANWMAHYDALYATAQQKMSEITAQSDKYVQDTKKLLADLTDGPGGFVDTFATILVHSGSFGDAVKGVWAQLKGDTLNIFSDLLSGIIHSFLDELLHQVEEYVAKMLIKLAVLKAVSFFGAIFGFAEGGVVGGGEGGGSRSADGYAQGGVVYAAQGWMQPQGTDTVPAMLTPGERVLTVQDTQTFERSGGLGALRAGQMGGSSSGLESRIDAMHATLKRQGEQFAALIRTQPIALRHALRGA